MGFRKENFEGGVELQQQGEGEVWQEEGNRKRPVLGEAVGLLDATGGDHIFPEPPELSSLPGSRDYLGTDAEKVTFRHRLSVVNYAIISALQTSATRGWWSASL